MIWFTSDLHFLHEAVIKYCNRPFSSVEEMNNTLIENWNKKVNDNDIVYVLGDLTLASYKEVYPLLIQLKGKKTLIKGNHDKFSDAQYNNMGFTVYREVKMKLFGHMLRLSHYPYAYPWYKRLFAYASELRFMDRRPPKIKGEYLLHGHTHTKKKLHGGNMIHVGIDAWNYSPVSSKEIESLIAKSK